MKPDRITEYDPDLHPEMWKKCGTCPTLLPVVDRSFPEWKGQRWHRRNEAGDEMCGECTDAVMDAEQEAAEEAWAEERASHPRGRHDEMMAEGLAP